MRVWPAEPARSTRSSPDRSLIGGACQNQAHLLLVFTASPGTEGYEKLKLLSVIGTQSLNAGSILGHVERDDTD